jgi:hypothetical protein
MPSKPWETVLVDPGARRLAERDGQSAARHGGLKQRQANGQLCGTPRAVRRSVKDAAASGDRTDRLSAAQAVAGHKSLQTTLLELRPIFHRMEDGVRARAFLGMLAYDVV